MKTETNFKRNGNVNNPGSGDDTESLETEDDDGFFNVINDEEDDSSDYDEEEEEEEVEEDDEIFEMDSSDTDESDGEEGSDGNKGLDYGADFEEEFDTFEETDSEQEESFPNNQTGGNCENESKSENEVEETHFRRKIKNKENVVKSQDEYADYDTSDEEDIRNTVGNVPKNWYDEYKHLGYDWDGKQILKPETGDQIDQFLKRMEDPDFWRTVKDPQTGQDVILSEEDINTIKRIHARKIPDVNFDEYAIVAVVISLSNVSCFALPQILLINIL